MKTQAAVKIAVGIWEVSLKRVVECAPCGKAIYPWQGRVIELRSTGPREYVCPECVREYDLDQK